MRSMRELLKPQATPVTDEALTVQSGNSRKGGGPAEVMNGGSNQNDRTIRWLRKALGKTHEALDSFCNKQLSLCLCYKDIKDMKQEKLEHAISQFSHKNHIPQNQHVIYSLFILKLQHGVGISIQNWVRKGSK